MLTFLTDKSDFCDWIYVYEFVTSPMLVLDEEFGAIDRLVLVIRDCALYCYPACSSISSPWPSASKYWEFLFAFKRDIMFECFSCSTAFISSERFRGIPSHTFLMFYYGMVSTSVINTGSSSKLLSYRQTSYTIELLMELMSLFRSLILKAWFWIEFCAGFGLLGPASSGSVSM